MTQAVGIDRRGMGVLALGHLLADTAQGAVPALLPFLVAERDLSYTAAAALVLAATVASSVMQPLFGLFSDRRSLAWLMPVGVLLAGVGIALVGVSPSYTATFLAVVLSGIGVAAFHPEGSRYANYVSGARRASGMSFFAVGGNVGVALGPVLVTPLVLIFGLPGTLALAVPAAVVALVLLVELPRLRAFRPATSARAGGSAAPEAWGPFARLGGVIATRTFVYFGLVTFVPLWFVDRLDASAAAGNTALSLLLFGGAAGTLVGGRLADRFGRRSVLLGSMAVLPPLLLAFSLSGPTVATAIAVLIGAATIATFSVTVVMGQEYLPGRIGLASGITLGLAIGLGGVGAPVFGVVADRFGLDTTMVAITVLPLVGLLMALTLPRAAPRAPGADDSGSPDRSADDRRGDFVASGSR